MAERVVTCTCVSEKRKTACWSVSVDFLRMTFKSSRHSFIVYDLLISTCKHRVKNLASPRLRCCLLAHLVEVVVGHVRGKVRERLPTGTTDSDEECVTARLLDDASDARNVFDRKSASHHDVTIDRLLLKY